MATGPKVAVEIQRQTFTPDGMGGSTSVWYGVKRLKGTMVALKAKENFSNSSTKVTSTHLFQCPYPKDIAVTEKDRLLCKGVVHEITFADDSSKRGITLILELKKIT